MTLKKGLHPRNRHRERYNFQELIKSWPPLGEFVSINKFNQESVDFSNAEAVMALNKALLKHFYGVEEWSIPENYLCPPIPGRAEYLHNVADLLSSCNNNILPPGKSVKVLDIGIGANCIYPILGNREYGWNFVGSDIDPVALESANRIISSNSFLRNTVECRLQKGYSNIFKQVIQKDEFFDLSICNPPFHSSYAEAQEGTKRKWKNLGIKKNIQDSMNFGGVFTEICFKGGEEAFLTHMIEQSGLFAYNCLWFTSLVSKSTNLPIMYDLLNKGLVSDIKTITLNHGNKTSRLVAWTYLDEEERGEWRRKRWS